MADRLMSYKKPCGGTKNGQNSTSISGILLIASLVAIVCFGSTYLNGYLKYKDYEETVCRVVSIPYYSPGDARYTCNRYSIYVFQHFP